jgi:hypothetical protein
MLRRRQTEMEPMLDQQLGQTVTQGPSLLVQVFAETTVPTAALKYFACHPLTISGSESEGTVPTLTVDTTQKLYVAVLGSKVPVAGDNLIARLIGGRWVAENGGGIPAVVSCGTIKVTVNGCNTKSMPGAVVTLSRKLVATITVTNGGTGYTSAPTVTFGTTNGNGATATATISGGAVTAVTVTAGGAYTAAPTVGFTGGGGSGATATSTLSAATTVDTVTTSLGLQTVTITNAGSGYKTNPNVTVTGGGGSGAVVTATISNAAVASVSLTNGGSNYTTAPAVTVTGGGTGSGATVTSRLTAGPVTSLTIQSGAGYTPGLGYALAINGDGTGAAGTFDVDSAGRVVNLVLTAGGSGYTTVTSIDFPGAGSGSGAWAYGTVSGGAVTGFILTSSSGYITGTGYALGFSGGGGTGAAGTFDVNVNSEVQNLVLTNGGSGYTTAPTLSFPGAGGSGARGTAGLAPQPVAGLTLTAGGSGYSTAPTLTISPPRTGSTATGTATLANQNVASLTIANPGHNFTSIPTLAIDPPPSGTTATATAIINSNETGNRAFFTTPSIGIYTASAVPPAGVSWWNTAPVTVNISVATCATNAAGSVTLLPATGYACTCANCRDPVPSTATLTDANGTITLTFSSGAWRGCYSLSGQTVQNFSIVSSLARCQSGTTTGSIPITYHLLCPNVGTGWSLSQMWTTCTYQSGSPPGDFAIAGTCTDAPTNALPPTSVSSGGQAPDACNTSSTFTISGGIVNGTVTVSFP